jgi:hypothetical protein
MSLGGAQMMGLHVEEGHGNTHAVLERKSARIQLQI